MNRKLKIKELKQKKLRVIYNPGDNYDAQTMFDGFQFSRQRMRYEWDRRVWNAEILKEYNLKDYQIPDYDETVKCKKKWCSKIS